MKKARQVPVAEQASATLETVARSLKTNGQRPFESKVAAALLKKAESAVAVVASRDVALEEQQTDEDYDNGVVDGGDVAGLNEMSAKQDDMPRESGDGVEDDEPQDDAVADQDQEQQPGQEQQEQEQEQERQQQEQAQEATPATKKKAATSRKKSGEPTRSALHKQAINEAKEIIAVLKSPDWTSKFVDVAVVILIDVLRAWNVEDEHERRKLLPSDSKESESLTRALFAGKYAGNNNDKILHRDDTYEVSVREANVSLCEIAQVLQKAVLFAQTSTPNVLTHVIQDVLNGVTHIRRVNEVDFPLPVRCAILNTEITDDADVYVFELSGWLDGKAVTKKIYVASRLHELLEALVKAQAFWAAVAQIAIDCLRIPSNNIKCGKTSRRSAITTLLSKDPRTKGAILPKIVTTLVYTVDTLYHSINKIDAKPKQESSTTTPAKKGTAAGAKQRKTTAAAAAPMAEDNADERGDGEDDGELVEQEGHVDVFSNNAPPALDE
jgi:hypothetical protein